MALTDNIVSYWKLDETSGTRADSAASNTLADNNTVGFDTGKISNAALFVAANSEYLSIADASQTGLDFTSGGITFAGWAYFNTVVGDTCFLSKWRTPATADRGYFLAIRGAGTTIVFGKSTDGTNVDPQYQGMTVNWTPSTATWYHVVMAYEAVGKTVKFYINGSQQGTTQTFTSAGIFNNTVSFKLGWDAGDFTNYFDGRLDEWGAWSRELSSAEVTELYNSGAGLTYPFTTTVANKNLGLLGVGK